MISKKDLQGLIKEIKKRTNQTQEQVSVGAGYKAKTLTQLLSKNEDLEPAYNQLKIAYAEVLNNSTFPSSDIASSLKAITKALQRIENGQLYIRAEVRGYGQFQIMEKAQWDQGKFLKAMERVGMLVGANLAADDLQGTSEHGDS